MRYRTILIAVALAALTGAASADHDKPGLFTDIGTPPADEDVSHGNLSTELLIARCNYFLANVQTDTEGHIKDYRHDYQGGFCVGWINASMVFLNVRDGENKPALGVCLPEGIHTLEVIRTFLDFTNANPDEWKYSPSFLIYWSMLDKYPCRQKDEKN
jgi:hypothetical protein